MAWEMDHIAGRGVYVVELTIVISENIWHNSIRLSTKVLLSIITCLEEFDLLDVKKYDVMKRVTRTAGTFKRENSMERHKTGFQDRSTCKVLNLKLRKTERSSQVVGHRTKAIHHNDVLIKCSSDTERRILCVSSGVTFKVTDE